MVQNARPPPRTQHTAGAASTTSSGLISRRRGDASAKALIRPPPHPPIRILTHLFTSPPLPPHTPPLLLPHLKRGGSPHAESTPTVRQTGRIDTSPDTMRGSSRYGAGVGSMVALNALLLLLLAAQAARGASTDHLLVQLREDAQDEAHQLATQHGFQSARKVNGMLGSHCRALLPL